MGRRAKQYSHCVPRAWSANQYPFEGNTETGMVDTWCGKSRAWDRDKPLESPRIATCPKCAQAIGKRTLAARPRLRIERRPEPLAYDKSTYNVFIDGVHRAYVGIANGWGEKWYLAKLADPKRAAGWINGRHGGTVSGHVVDYFGHERLSADTIFWPVHFAARDAMACAALTYFERFGVAGLPTVEEMAVLEAERKEREAVEAQARETARQERQRERERLETERQERLALWHEALASLDARGDLSNIERAGLEAIKSIMESN